MIEINYLHKPVVITYPEVFVEDATELPPPSTQAHPVDDNFALTAQAVVEAAQVTLPAVTPDFEIKSKVKFFKPPVPESLKIPV